MIKILKKYKYIITLILIIIIFCFVMMRKNTLKNINEEYNNLSSNISINDVNVNEKNNKECTSSEENISVDIKGQVVNPGVYELSSNSRVIDVIKEAGGLTDVANTTLINLAKKLEDQMVIIIYSNEEVLNSNIKEIETVFKIIEKECVCPNIKNDSCINTELDNEDVANKNEVINNSKNEDVKIIDINIASVEELTTLPSIGESKAKAIVEYRKEKKFDKIEDIKNVSGIGDALFEKIKDYIKV